MLVPRGAPSEEKDVSAEDVEEVYALTAGVSGRSRCPFGDLP